MNSIVQFFEDIPRIPISEWTEATVKFITKTFSFVFNPIQEHFGNFMDFTSDKLSLIPVPIFIVILGVIAFFITGRRFGLATFAVIGDRKSTRLNSSHVAISYAVFCLK